MQDEIARIRGAEFSSAVESTPSFTLSRRGYDRDEVDRFLAELADRLEQGELERVEAPQPPRSDAMRRELELMSQKTVELLAQAEESAERVRSEATQEASRVLSRAREDVGGAKQAAEEARQAAVADSERVTREADAYAERVRAEAEADAKALRSQAASELAEAVDRAEVAARASVEADDEQRAQLSAELVELTARRDAARDELRKIAGVLASAVGAAEVDEPEAQPPLRAV